MCYQTPALRNPVIRSCAIFAVVFATVLLVVGVGLTSAGFVRDVKEMWLPGLVFLASGALILTLAVLTLLKIIDCCYLQQTW